MTRLQKIRLAIAKFISPLPKAEIHNTNIEISEPEINPYLLTGEELERACNARKAGRKY